MENTWSSYKYDHGVRSKKDVIAINVFPFKQDMACLIKSAKIRWCPESLVSSHFCLPEKSC